MPEESYLARIHSPEDLRDLHKKELPALCEELRETLIRTVSRTGGHLSSNLGVVELTVALHRVFSLPHDCIVWDVGHQCYVHKLLTGRAERFDTLRTEGGISGFPRPCESDYDSFIVGHSSTSISAANGIAKAKALAGDDGYVVAVIGDGALTGGLAYEGLSNAGRSSDRLIVVLNDNRMSISRNVGFMARHLTTCVRGRAMCASRTASGAFNHVPLIGVAQPAADVG
ncbi:MAG: 1-deoxy-D-xylulose-5-phosphate synthase N-terminal domain-containing protein [Acutalibacteraceae bacterium]